MPERNQVQDAGVEHDFYGDEDNDRVLARQRAGQADCEQQSRQDQVMSKWNAHRRRRTSSSAMTTAPMSAAVSSTAIASNGTTQSAMRILPSCSTELFACAPDGVAVATLSPLTAHQSIAA